jgi:hypothetical protein
MAHITTIAAAAAAAAPAANTRFTTSVDSATPQLQAFFAYLPDKTDEGAFARRMSVRPQHLVRAKELFESGIFRA